MTLKGIWHKIEFGYLRRAWTQFHTALRSTNDINKIERLILNDSYHLSDSFWLQLYRDCSVYKLTHVLLTTGSLFSVHLRRMSKYSLRLKNMLSSVSHCSVEAAAYSQCVIGSPNTIKGSCQKEFALLQQCIKVAASKRWCLALE